MKAKLSCEDEENTQLRWYFPNREPKENSEAVVLCGSLRKWRSHFRRFFEEEAGLLQKSSHTFRAYALEKCIKKTCKRIARQKS